jgi:uncharacterized protein YkwD
MRTRRAALAALGAGLVPAAVVVPAVPETANASPARADRLERQVIRHVNAVRRAHGLRTLRRSRGLQRAADFHSWEILRSNVLSHTSPDGTPMARRIRRFVRARAVGETIAWVSPRTRRQASVIVGSWMRSPGHRAALLNPGFRRVGVGRRTGSLRSTRVSVTTLNLASAR